MSRGRPGGEPEESTQGSRGDGARSAEPPEAPVDPAALLARLDEIAASLERSGHGRALLGLGSVGLELDRLDRYSDLDFFAVVDPGHKARYLEDLGWLTDVAPVAFAFRNTPDGFKLLYADGVFCEFAVFEPEELARIPFVSPRVVWARDDAALSVVAAGERPASPPPDVAWALGEALTNLYVGLGRFRRGEKLAAARLVQVFAVDRVLEVAEGLEPRSDVPRDVFAPERRVERRLPSTAGRLPGFVQGYDRTPESARAILTFLEEHVTVDDAMRRAILDLCD